MAKIQYHELYGYNRVILVETDEVFANNHLNSNEYGMKIKLANKWDCMVNVSLKPSRISLKEYLDIVFAGLKAEQSVSPKNRDKFIGTMDELCSRYDLAGCRILAEAAAKPKPAPRKKPDPKKKDPAQKKPPVGNDPTRGYTHVSGGEGNLYVKGEMNPKQAQKTASTKGADAKLVKGKLVPLTNDEKAASTGGKPEAQANGKPTKGGNASGSKVVKTIDKDSKEYRDLKNGGKKASKRPVGDIDQDKQVEDRKKSLSQEHTTGKNKEVDQKAAKSAVKSKYYTEEPEISDDDFDYKNDEYWVDDQHRLTFSDDITNGKMPKKELKLLERLANTVKNSTTAKITHFSPKAGAGEISSQAGELCMQMFASMPVEDREDVKNDIVDFLKENGNKCCLSAEWVEAAFNNSMAMENYLDARYGEGQHELVASAWDTKEGVEAMTGRDMHTDGSKGYSTDAFFTVKGPDGKIDMIEISLKKDLGVKLLNSGPSEVLSRVPELEGGKLDYTIFKEGERQFLKKVATDKNLGKAIKMLQDAEKNISKYGKAEQGKIKDAIKSLQKIDKGMNPKKIVEALKNKPGGKEEMRAAWKPLYVASEVFKDKEFNKIKEQASKMYSDYQNNFFEEFKKNKKVEDATMDIIRKELPLVSVLENEEVLVAGKYSVDRVTMKKIFGVDTPKDFKESLKVYENPPPPFIGYAAGNKETPIPIALVRMRAEALGYGQRIKFDMDIHPKFAAAVKKANDEVYGDGENSE